MEVTAESPRRRSSASSSPEFEFWMLRNPPSSNPQQPIVSADELFANGILLPLHIISLTPTPTPNPNPSTTLLSPPPTPRPQPARSEESPPSRKWKDIFKPGDKNSSDKKDRKPSSTAAAAAAEINIHIWPFSRSRSSGNGRPRAASNSTTRKTSSAPCSRCNSHGDSSKRGSSVSPAAAVRKWTPNPPRPGGIYLGRSNPIWQLRRRVVGGGKKDNSVAGVGKVANSEKEAEAINDERSRSGCGGNGGGGVDGEANGGLFNIKAIFTRKVYGSVRL